NNQTVFKYLEADGSHPLADFYIGLGFQVNETDSIRIIESIFPDKDTLVCSYLINGEEVYSKFLDEYVLKDPRTNEKFAVELYENGKVKKRENKSNNNTKIFYKNGNISWESC